MRRRNFLFVASSCLPFCASAAAASQTISGVLILLRPAKPALQSADRTLAIHGDESTMGVLLDKRVRGLTFQLTGVLETSGTLEVGPIHTKSMVVLKDVRKLFVTYWCDICSIRTYTPGICWCCQEETELDLRERYDS